MKKIAFSDRYGLTQAVLEGRKTMTRRIIPDIEIDLNRRGRFKLPIKGFEHGVLFMDTSSILPDCYSFPAPRKYQPRYEIGEEVAVAQAYSSVFDELYANVSLQEAKPILEQSESAGWSNKMFTRADLMPHRICITDIKLERIQDISDEDCMKEGVFKYEKPPLHHEYDMYAPWPPYVKAYKYDCDNLQYRCNARAAFRILIDRISGRGTWERNPWVYAYSFELVKKEEEQ